jgi:hypothetical protein
MSLHGYSASEIREGRAVQTMIRQFEEAERLGYAVDEDVLFAACLQEGLRPSSFGTDFDYLVYLARQTVEEKRGPRQ